VPTPTPDPVPTPTPDPDKPLIPKTGDGSLSRRQTATMILNLAFIAFILYSFGSVVAYLLKRRKRSQGSEKH
jgi:hypothetical protein